MNKDSTARVIKQDEKSGTSTREYIELYHKLGWNVIALEKGEKRPAWSSWKEAQENKQDDSITQLKYWDDVNVGIICGRISENLFVVDCDTEKSALWFIQNFKEYIGTYQVKTKRGMHYYFQIKGDIEKVESFKIKMEDEDIQIDVQGDGKYVVAPPSIVEYEGGVVHEYQAMGSLNDVITLSVEEYENFINKLKSLLQKRELKTISEGTDESKEQENTFEIDLGKFKELIKEHYREGVRHNLVLYSSGFLRKNGVDKETVIQLFEEICDETGDEEKRSRLNDIRTTYENDIKKIAGYSKLIELIPSEKLEQCIKSQRTIPEPFFVENNILHEAKAKTTEPICEYFYISDCVVNVKDGTNVGYILKFPHKNKEIYVSLDDLSKNKFTKFFGKHISVIDDSTSQKILKYITRYTLTNKQFLKVRYAVDSVGWINGDYYLPQLKPNHYFTNASGFGNKGEKQKEEELFKMLVEEKSYLSLGYAIGVASILLPLLDRDNFVVYSYGRTGAGKSTMSFLALSLFGSYEALKASNDNATTGFELFLKQRNHAIAVLDELNTSAGDSERVAENLIRTIYKFHAGQGRLRATVDLHMREQTRFEGILYISAEDDLKTFLKMSKKTVKGIYRRTIVVDFERLFHEYGGEENLQRWTEAVYHVIRENYGNMLSDIVSRVKNDINRIKEDYENFKSYYKNEDLGWRFEGQERAFALLATAVKFLERHTSLNMGFLYDIVDEIATQNHQEFNKGVKASREELIAEIESWVAENYWALKVTQTREEEIEINDKEGTRKKKQIIESTTKQPNRNLFGKIEDGKLLLTSPGLTSLARYMQTSESNLKHMLANFGLAEKDDSHIIKRTMRVIDGIKLKVYELAYSEPSEPPEPDNDSLF